MAQYNIGRDKAEAMAHTFHFWIGADQAARAAVAKAKEAQAEYEKDLLALMAELGIPREMIGQIHVDWGGTVTVKDPFAPVSPAPAPVAVPA